MRPGNNTRRPRGRPNRKQHVSPRTQTFDSHGPDVRIRGNAPQVYEKYLSLARDAHSAGDRVASESYYQFAEHYFRIMNDSTDPQRPGQPPRGNQESPRPHPQDQHPQDQHPQDRQAQDRHAQDQRPQDQQQVDQEQPHVEWPARADGINGAPAEQPVATQPPAENAEPPVADGEVSVAEEPAPTRRVAKPRQRSRRRAPNGAEAGAGGKVEKPEKSETVVNEDTPSPAPDQDATDEVKPAE